MTEEQFIQKGFNAGYQLQKHDAEICQSIQNSFTDLEHPYAVGFLAGGKEYINELEAEKKFDNQLLSKYFDQKGTEKTENTPDLEDQEPDFER